MDDRLHEDSDATRPHEAQAPPGCPYDPLDPAHAGDPWERLATARRIAPVARPAPGIVFVARDADVRAAFRDVAHLSNVGNFQLDGEGADLAPTIAQLDPPKHTAMRRLLHAAFTPQAIADVEPHVVKTAHALLDAVESSGRADLIPAYCGPLPATVIAHIVGVPEHDRDAFYDWTVEITSNLPHSFLHTTGWREFRRYLETLIARRRQAPTEHDDLVARLMAAEVDGLRLTDDEVLMAVWQLIVAGNDTTSRLLASCVYRLLAARELWEQVRADRALVPVAIEEALRLDPPLHWAMRTVVGATDVGGEPVEPGERVLLGIASANHDESVWPEPESFRFDRPNPRDHVAFGYGIHNCLGAPLARLEGTIALHVLLDRLPRLRLAPGFVYEPSPSPMLLGPAHLRVEWT